MRILFLTDNFPPESNAPAVRTFEHCREWVNLGHEVTVVTCFPNFPEGALHPGYKNRWPKVYIIDGIKVVRVPTFIARNSGVFLRAIDYASFMLSSFLTGLFLIRHDVVIGTSPQFLTALSACVLAKLKKTKFVFEVRDIWPAAIVAVGAMKRNAFIGVLEKIEVFLYKHADLIICVTKSFKKDIANKLGSNKKIDVVFNGFGPQASAGCPTEIESWVSAVGSNNDYNVGYLGTIGMAHSIDTILDAAHLLRQHTRIKFLIVGEGAWKEKINNRIKSEEFANVKIYSKISKAGALALVEKLDISLVSLIDSDLFKGVIPSKIYEAASLNTTLVAAIPKGEACSMIKNNNLGLCIPAENAKDLAQAVLQLSREDHFGAGANNKRIKFNLAFSRKKQAQKMLKSLLKLTG